jgi:phosphohistidine phosphatase
VSQYVRRLYAGRIVLVIDMDGSSNSAPLRLLLLRHAKSAWPPDVADHDRPLAERGRKAAPLIGSYMADERLLPELVLVSTARRAQETWELVARFLPGTNIRRDAPDLYAASAARMAGILLTIDPAIKTILLVGHNPGLEDFAAGLVGTGDADARRRMSAKFSTGGLAVISFRADSWKDVGPGRGQLERFVTPRMLA